MVTKEQLQALPEVVIVNFIFELGTKKDWLEMEKDELIDVLLNHPNQTALQKAYDEYIDLEEMTK